MLSRAQSCFQCLFVRRYGKGFPLTTHLAEKMEDANKAPALVVMTLLERGNWEAHLSTSDGHTWRDTPLPISLFPPCFLFWKEKAFYLLDPSSFQQSEHCEVSLVSLAYTLPLFWQRRLCACLGWVRMWLTSLLPPNPSLVKKKKKRKKKSHNISSGVSHSRLASLSLLWLQACVPVPTLTFPNPYLSLLWFFSSHHVVPQDLLFWPKSSPNSLRIWGDCPWGSS